MSDLLTMVRAVVRDEMRRLRAPELASVTQVYAKTGDDDVSNHQVNVRLRCSGLELQRVPVAVGRLGWSALPNVGDLMLLAFVGGDLNAPVAVGCVYDDQAHPPVAQEHEVVYEAPDDQDSNVRRLHVALPSGSTLTLDDDKLDIEFGDTSVVINRDGDVVVKSKGKLHLESQGDLELEAQGDVKVSAQGSVSVQGMSVKVEGQSQTSIKGPQISIAGMTQFSPS